jgi:hypothetical protein
MAHLPIGHERVDLGHGDFLAYCANFRTDRRYDSCVRSDKPANCMSLSICWASGESGTPLRCAGVDDGRGVRCEFGERRAMV